MYPTEAIIGGIALFHMVQVQFLSVNIFPVRGNQYDGNQKTDV
jgi:hypothetical protein